MSKFPMVFPVCKICGSDETVATQAFREEIEAGNKDIPILPNHCLETEVRYLQDPKKAKFYIATMILYWDICAGCGVRRLIRAEKLKTPIETVRQGGAGPGLRGN